MEKISNVKSFREAFIDDISVSLAKQGYQYKKSKEAFIKSYDDHKFCIFIYMYRRTSFIEIETSAYYTNKTIEKKLKEIGIKVLGDSVWGGHIKLLSEYYFGIPYPERYSNLIYEFGEEISPLIQTWLTYYYNIIEPFLKDCTNPRILNKIVNEERIDTSGLTTTYENRVLRFHYVGKMAGLSDDELRRLSDLYEDHLISFNAIYLPEFIEMKNKVIL